MPAARQVVGSERGCSFWAWILVLSLCLIFCLHWLCVSIGVSGLVSEPKGQMEENRERGL